ncbi:MAG: class I SAM-dependent methyltransferase [Sphingomonas sp.]|nr:class I SAM-dependent methyltransferase [Sphingomonas sp.]
MPVRVLHQLQMVVNYLKLGRWMKQHSFAIPKRVRTRDEVFNAVAATVRDKRVLYLEFGVFRGASMRYWSNALKHPDTILHGFDSFEGLPEDFDVNGPYTKGTFNVGGQLPQIADPRLRFYKGWFEDTLSTYEVPTHDVLVLNLDADLYSSTKTVFDRLERYILPNTYIYFDDMSRPDHEPRAFSEFMAETGKTFELVVADSSLNSAFFRCTG